MALRATKSEESLRQTQPTQEVIDASPFLQVARAGEKPFKRALRLQCRDIYPGALLPALDALLCQLNAFRAFEQAPAERLVLHHVAQEELPLALEGVVERVLLRHFLPGVEVI